MPAKLENYTLVRGRDWRPSNLPYPQRPRDSQRQRVYDWERANGFYSPQTRKLSGVQLADEHTAYRVLMAAWKAYGDGLPMPSMRFVNNRNGNCMFTYTLSGSINLISISMQMLRAESVIHEATHAVIHQRVGPYRFQCHGPEFVGLYIDMLYTLLGKDESDLMQSALARGLMVTPVEKIKWDLR